MLRIEYKPTPDGQLPIPQPESQDLCWWAVNDYAGPAVITEYKGERLWRRPIKNIGFVIGRKPDKFSF